MSTKKVPLVIYENGVRKEIGECTLQIKGENIAIVGKMDEEIAKTLFGDLLQVSIGRKKNEDA